MGFALKATIIGLLLTCVACTRTSDTRILYVSCSDSIESACSNSIVAFDPQTLHTRSYLLGEVGYPLAPSSAYGTVTYISRGGLHTLNLETGETTRIESGVLGTTSPDGKFLLIEKFHDDGEHIYLHNYQFNQARELVNRPVKVVAWSPDSRHVFVVTSDTEEALIVNIFSGEEQLIRNMSNTGVATPSWSKDGKRIAYAAAYNGTMQIFIMDLDGYIQRVTSSMKRAIHPIWVGENALAFSDIDNLEQDSLYIVDLQTLVIETLFVANHLLGVSESPDTRHIAFIDSGKDFAKRLCIITISDRTTECYTDILTIAPNAIPAWIELD